MIRAMTEPEKSYFCGALHYNRTAQFKGIVREVDFRLAAMVGFDDFTHNSCQMHVWSAGGLSWLFIHECFRYVYEICNLGVAITVIPCNNAASLKLNEKLGFRRILTIKDGYALGTDLAIQELRREECRWLERSHRGFKERRSRSSRL